MKTLVQEFLSARLGLAVELTQPKDPSLGHFATTIAFKLAKQESKNPNEKAQELAKLFENPSLFDKISTAGGYINFELSAALVDKIVTAGLSDKQGFARGTAGESETIFLEFISANPTGPLHIGHARGAIYGDALRRIGTHLGKKIFAEYYINDAGSQIDMLGQSIFHSARELLGKGAAGQNGQDLSASGQDHAQASAQDLSQGAAQDLAQTNPTQDNLYKGEYIKDLALEAIQTFGEPYFANAKDASATKDLATWGKDKMLDLIKLGLKQSGIEFDNFASETALFGKWQQTLSTLEKNDALYKDQDGKIWLRSSAKGDAKDRVIVRENGVPTYLAGDIIYHAYKYEQHFDSYINIWGADHHGYIPRIKAAIDFLGYDSRKLEILLSQMVALLRGGEPYKMSKRAGNFILMDDVVQDIGIDALRFVFLTKRADTHLEFDVDVLKNQDSTNPIYYINYAHARIKSVFARLGVDEETVASVPLGALKKDEKDLLILAAMLPQILRDSFNTRNINILTKFLSDLSAALHRFYTDNTIKDSPRQQELLKIVSFVALSLKTGLKVIGIEAKNKM
ncbi:MAG: arginine--tRNA ligase [Helicobacteraceae bacterium]